ncbi:hypothetical protein FHR32_005727 [Streptosporangium album]|uniref:DUF5666 domain-containing protein n=1 Tax=Streptosporangium album TaxID=47479 RepID=A0A7W7RZY2_9ACTN|nr:DUF5666 domain-containing protein [Streptosporangium album]MBB4941350.1 hypothetical protein [Streptosporangium album]
MEEETTRRGLFSGAFRNRAGESPLPPSDAPVAVLVAGSGRDVTVRGYGQSASLTAAEPVAAQAEELPYGWALRPGDLVVLDEPTPGARVAVTLHRNVTGRITDVAPDRITVAGQTCRLDPRTLHYEELAPEPSAKPLADPLKAGDFVTLECFDNRVDGTLTVHFMRRTRRA